jgi:DNA-binding SARP family transcriptional activator
MEAAQRSGEPPESRPEAGKQRPETPALAIRLLGPFEVRVGGKLAPPFRSRRSQWLLALLILRAGRELERSWLAGVLWPESPESAAFTNLRQSLADVRRVLGPEAHRLRSPSLRSVALDLPGAEVDLIAFDALAARDDPASLERAVTLYQGPLLPGCLEQWLLEARRPREEAYLAALEKLAAHATARGDPQAAARYLRLATQADPLRETAQRALMEALAASGNHAAAAMVYRDLRLHLHRELNAEPDPATTALFHRLREEARAGEQRGRGAEEQRGRGEEVRLSSAPLLPCSPARQPLPRPLTRFIGQEEQVAAIQAHLTDPSAPCRLLTLVGPGGVGKTRLAIQVAGAVTGHFTGGACFVDLASLREPELVPQTVAAALELRLDPAQPPLLALAGALRDRTILLLLDNCEHLVEACAGLAEALLQEASGLSLLATSREALGLPSELLWRVPSLSLPLLQGPSPSLAELKRSEAVCLFIQRGAAALPQPRRAPSPPDPARHARLELRPPLRTGTDPPPPPRRLRRTLLVRGSGSGLLRRPRRQKAEGRKQSGRFPGAYCLLLSAF